MAVPFNGEEVDRHWEAAARALSYDYAEVRLNLVHLNEHYMAAIRRVAELEMQIHSAEVNSDSTVDVETPSE